PSTRIAYHTASPGAVRLSVYSLIGQELETLVDARQEAGGHAVEWNAGRYPSGVYLCRLSAGGNVMLRKMVVLK
ncbi:MAG: T9SS type A sorting domain-containing protein, partial [Ignavibacteriales bacterium]|nr:T9SS type A sorting domain-containing protein [Ignavibacteriales bacterium]